MKPDNNLKLSIGVGISAVAICLFAAGLSYRTYIKAGEDQKNSRQTIESLRQDVLRLEARLAKIDNPNTLWYSMKVVRRWSDPDRRPGYWG